MVEEQLDPSHPLTHLDSLAGVTRQQLVTLLTSAAVAEAVAAVAAAHAAANPSLKGLTPRAVAGLLRRAVAGTSSGGGGLMLVSELRTRVVNVATGRDITKDGAARRVRG